MNSTQHSQRISVVKELYIPFVVLIAFFLVQALGIIGEVGLTLGIIGVTLFTFAMRCHVGEVKLLLIGTALGAFLEIGLRVFGFQQVWTRASLFGVPYWLPLIWGLGFVLITRLGIYIRKMQDTVDVHA